MKNLKKFLAIILSITMVMCSTLPSVASEIEVIDETTKSKIEEQLREDLGEERANEILNGSEEITASEEETTIGENADDVGAKLGEPEEEETTVEANVDDVGGEQSTGLFSACGALPEEEEEESEYEETESVETNETTVVEEETTVGAKFGEPEEEEEETTVAEEESIVGGEQSTGLFSVHGALPEDEETTIASTSEPEEDEETTVATISEPEVDDATISVEDEETTVATISEPEEIVISIASKSTTDKTLYGKSETWMYWWLTDNGKTIHYSNIEPTTVSNYYGVDSGIDSIYNSYEGAGIDKSKIEKAVFENEIVADTCANFFAEFINLNTITNLDYLDTNRVTNMTHMFFECQKLISLDLSSFNTSNVTDMECLFSYCTELTYVDLSGFDTSNVTSMYLMFYDCESIQNLDLRNFDTRQVTNMKSMFKACHELETILVSNTFVTGSVTESDSMFENCSKLKGGAGTTYDNYHKDIEYARIDGGTSAPGYFTDASTVPWMYWRLEDNETGKTIIFSSTYKDGTTSITGDGEINYGSLDKDEITKAVFEDVIHAETCDRMFDFFKKLLEIENISNLKTNRVKDMSLMFNMCTELQYLDISNFNTSNVEKMDFMFQGCKFDSLDFKNAKNFVTGKVTSMISMFNICRNLNELDLRRFNTSIVTDMSGMFQGCTSLTTIYVSNTFVTDLVSESNLMFDNCPNLKGGAGTTYDDSNPKNKTLARIDGGLGSTNPPGYFTDATDAPWMYWYLTDEDNDGENDTINYSNTPVSAYTCYKVEGTDNFNDNYDSHGLDKTKIKKAIFHNRIEALTCSDLFNEFTVLEEIDSLSNLKTDEVTSMEYMFALCPSLKNIDISSLNTSKVTSMSGMFMACASFDSIDFNSAIYFNTSSVTKMTGMFDGCVNLISLDLSKFNTANVEYMAGMFTGMTGLTKLDLRSFNTSKVDVMHSMFQGCPSLKTIIVSNDFDVTGVGNANNMFNGCTSLVGGKGTTFNPSNIGKEYARIDGGPTSATPGYFTDVATLPWMYWRLEDNDTGKTIIFSSTDEDKTGTTGISGNAAINYGSLDKTTVTKAVFEDEIEAVTCEELFYKFKYLKEIQDLSKLKTNKVTNMISMFRECFSLESIDIEYLNTSNVENMKYMFYDCYGLTSLDVSHFITIKVKNMYGMFGLCTSLTDLNLNNFNTDNVENMQQMFNNCQCLTYLDLSNFNTSKVTDMKEMFFGCRSLETIVVGNNFVTNMVTSNDDMFTYCKKLVGCYGARYDENKTNKEYARIDGYDEHGVYNPGYFSSAPWMYWYLGHNDTAIHYSSTKPASGGVGATRRDCMIYSGLSDEQREKITKATFENRIDAVICDTFFKYFRNLSSIENLVYLDTTNVIAMVEMFAECENLETLHWENLYASKVKSMDGMFADCKKLKSLVLSRWNTESLLSMVSMFENCSSLTLLDIKSLNTSFVGYMYGMFSGCTSLKELDLSKFNTASLISIDYMFNGCSSLERIYVSNEFVTTAVIRDAPMFDGCTSIKGSKGTTYDESHIGKEYARIDGGTAAPGYFYTNDWMWWAYDDTEHILYLYGTEPSIVDGVISGSGPIEYTSLPKGDVEKVTFKNEVRARTCEDMFNGFVALKEIEDIEYLNTSSVMSMEGMFNSCESLDKIYLSKFDTSRVTSMSNMFVSCRGLDELDLTTFDTSNVRSMDSMFAGCENLETITVSSKFVTILADYNNDMFNHCNALKGGKGTTYDPSRTSIEYARIDGGPTSATPGYFTLYVPPTPPAPTPTYPQNYSSDRDGGGGGGGIAGPLVDVIIPAVTYLPIVKNILAVVNNTTSKWTKDTITNKHKLNIINQNGTETPATLGFYNYTNVVTHIVNNVPVQTQTNDTYVFDDKGNMITGWVRTADGKWYLFEYEKTTNEGKMVIGWKKVQGAWYYFGTDGVMLTNAYTPDGHYVGPDGKWDGIILNK